MVRSLELDARAPPTPLPVRLRAVVRGRIDALYPERAGLGEALILARRERLSRDLRERWARAGLAHLLAISGFHVGVIAALLYLLARRVGFGPARAPLAAAAGSWAYVLAIGSPVAATRAAFILAALAAGRLLGRRVSPLGALATAFVAVLAARPHAITSVAFQLSFAGAAGLVLLAPPVSRALRTRPLARLPASLRTGLASGIAATAATLPLVAWHFGYFAAAGIPVTLVAGPLVAAAIPGMLLSILLSFVSLPLASIFAGGTDLFLQFADAIVSVVVGIPGASVWTPRWWIAAATAALRHLLASSLRGLALSACVPQVRAAAPGSACLAGAACRLAHPRTHRPRWRHGARLPGRGSGRRRGDPHPRPPLDPGRHRPAFTHGFDSGERIVRSVPEEEGRRPPGSARPHPPGSRPHRRCQRRPVRASTVVRVLDPGTRRLPAPPMWSALERARARGATWFAARAGDRVSADGVSLEVLHPGGAAAAAASDEANDQSVVLLLRYGDFTALLPGDAPAAVEEALLAADRIPPLDLLKAGHHGSRTSTSWKLLESTQPELSVVSAGARNRYGHPHAVVLEPTRARRFRHHAHRPPGNCARPRASPSGDFTVTVERCPGPQGVLIRLRSQP